MGAAGPWARDGEGSQTLGDERCHAHNSVPPHGWLARACSDARAAQRARCRHASATARSAQRWPAWRLANVSGLASSARRGPGIHCRRLLRRRSSCRGLRPRSRSVPWCAEMLRRRCPALPPQQRRCAARMARSCFSRASNKLTSGCAQSVVSCVRLARRPVLPHTSLCAKLPRGPQYGFHAQRGPTATTCHRPLDESGSKPSLSDLDRADSGPTAPCTPRVRIASIM